MLGDTLHWNRQWSCSPFFSGWGTLIVVDRRPHAPPGTDFSDLASWRLLVATRSSLRPIPFGVASMRGRVDQLPFLLQR